MVFVKIVHKSTDKIKNIGNFNINTDNMIIIIIAIITMLNQSNKFIACLLGLFGNFTLKLIDITFYLVSIVFTILISRYYYNKTNSNAFYTDILVPIINLEDSEEIYNKITECKKSFLYQFGKPTEINAIEELYSAAVDLNYNSYEHAFKESIWNYFYDLYSIQRKREEYDHVNNEKIIVNNFNETVDIVKYINCIDDESLGIENDLSEELYEFYREIVNDAEITEVKDNIIFKDKSVNDIFYESNEYKKYKNAKNNFNEKKNNIKYFNTK